ASGRTLGRSRRRPGAGGDADRLGVAMESSRGEGATGPRSVRGPFARLCFRQGDRAVLDLVLFRARRGPAPRAGTALGTRAALHVQRIKTVAARIAHGYAAHAQRRLTVVPVGLSFAARKRFRGRVLVSFGEPVAVSPHLAVYREQPAKALHALTTAIQSAM